MRRALVHLVAFAAMLGAALLGDRCGNQRIAWGEPAPRVKMTRSAGLAQRIELICLRRSTLGALGRTRVCRVLARRIPIEARRQGLDPMALVALADAESSWSHRTTTPARGHRHPSIGVWQLIPGEHAGQLAARQAMPPEILAYRRARRRPPRGRFSWSELRDPLISTYIAVREIAAHVRRCRRLQPRGHLSGSWRSCRGLPQWTRRNPQVPVGELARMAHYNGGPRIIPCAYVRKLAIRYRRFQSIRLRHSP